MFKQHRKVYDSAKHRVEGTELAQYLKTSNRRPQQQQQQQQRPQASQLASTSRPSANTITSKRSTSNTPKWKLDSLSFRQAIRQAKQVTVAEMKSKATGIPLHQLLPANSMQSSQQADYNSHNYVHCPHCGRSFNEKAGERHIPKVSSVLLLSYDVML